MGWHVYRAPHMSSLSGSLLSPCKSPSPLCGPQGPAWPAPILSLSLLSPSLRLAYSDPATLAFLMFLIHSGPRPASWPFHELFSLLGIPSHINICMAGPLSRPATFSASPQDSYLLPLKPLSLTWDLKFGEQCQASAGSWFLKQTLQPFRARWASYSHSPCQQWVGVSHLLFSSE